MNKSNWTMKDVIDVMDNSYSFDGLVDEQFWTLTNKSDVFEEMVRKYCKKNDIKFDNKFDFESEWDLIYSTSEKGLS